MLNSNSIYLDDFWFYENVININNVNDLLVDKKTRTYSIGKKERRISAKKNRPKKKKDFKEGININK
jgi:hypothetical protein